MGNSYPEALVHVIRYSLFQSGRWEPAVLSPAAGGESNPWPPSASKSAPGELTTFINQSEQVFIHLHVQTTPWFWAKRQEEQREAVRE